MGEGNVQLPDLLHNRCTPLAHRGAEATVPSPRATAITTRWPPRRVRRSERDLSGSRCKSVRQSSPERRAVSREFGRGCTTPPKFNDPCERGGLYRQSLCSMTCKSLDSARFAY